MKASKSFVSDIIIICALIFLALCLIIYPADTVSAAADAVNTCLYIVVPSLFPFFVLAVLSSKLGLGDRAGRRLSFIMRPVFGLSGGCAIPLVLGLVGGYPVGARAAAELYKSGGCSKEEAERLLAFCNNSGPAFIFGIVGSFIFGSVKLGALIYGIHIFSSLLIGVLFKHAGSSSVSIPTYGIPSAAVPPFHNCFILSVSSSILSMVNISGFIIFFSVFVKILSITDISDILCGFVTMVFPFLKDGLASSAVTGLFELTTGICSLKGKLADPALTAAVSSFLLGWAGISIHFQILSVIDDSGISPKYLYPGKLLHGIASAVISYIVFSFLPRSAFYVGQYAPSASFVYASISGRVLAASVIAVFIITLALFLMSAKKGGGKKRGNRV